MDWEAFVRLRHVVRHSIGQAERDFFNKQVTANKGNSGCIRKTTRRTIPTNPTQFHEHTKDTSTLANECNRFFFSFLSVKTWQKTEELARSYGLDIRPFLITTNVPHADDEQFEFQPVK